MRRILYLLAAMTWGACCTWRDFHGFAARDKRLSTPSQV